MPKLVVFDLDGVLIDSCDMHFNCFNQALHEATGRSLSKEEHYTSFNGLSTRMKLSKLGLDDNTANAVYLRKQALTEQFFEKIVPSERLRNTLIGLRKTGTKVMCASNCIRKTVVTVLKNLGIFEHMDAIFSNEDVTSPKPSPEIYTLAMHTANVTPEDTLIFEDSYIGLKAAIASKAHVHYVKSASDITLEYVLRAEPNLTKRVNIVIPMAGNGSRFASAGYKDPKPFIPVFGKPMISWVVDNLGIDATYTFIIRKEFEKTYAAREYLQQIMPGCNVISVDGVTEGAACTVLLAKEIINNDDPLMMINSDQFIEFDDCDTSFKFVFDFLYNPNERQFQGKISTFDGHRHPKWSYAKLDDNGVVSEVREKDPFSDHATTGLYMWRHGSDFVKYAEQMINKNIRVNNEFYVVPVFNEAIADGKQFTICPCRAMWGIGVPEDLDYFLANFKGSNVSDHSHVICNTPP